MGVGRIKRLVAPAVVLVAALVVVAGAGGQEAAPSAAAGGGEPMIGVVPQRSDLTEHQAELARAAGVDSVRFWLAWSTVEFQRDHYDWTGMDEIVRTSAIQGLDLVPYLFGTPEWAAKRDGYECEGFRCIPYAPASIETRSAFAHFALRAAERYGPKGQFWLANSELPYHPIRVWQIWNEQNSDSFFAPDPDPDLYATLLKTTAAQIYAADPGAEVILGGMFGKRSTTRLDRTTTFLRNLYRVPGVGASFDGVAIHPYDPTAKGVFDSVDDALKVIRRAGDDADLWITEIGWASSGKRTENLVKDPRLQARLLRRVFARFLHRAGRWRLRGAFWYAIRDTRPREAVCKWCAGAGLLSLADEPKPAYYALRRVTRSR